MVAALLLILPLSPVARDTCDLVEVNHFYDDCGKPVFDQVIFYDWSGDHSRYMVRDWRLLKHPSQIPARNWEGGGYLATWQDGEQLRRIEAASYRETWTQHDPELEARAVLPKDERRGLR